MLRDAIVVIILLMLAIGITDARLPQVGDKVTVNVNSGSHILSYDGTIADIGDGLMCLSLTANSGLMSNAPGDMCIGVGSIAGMTWS